MKTRGYLHVFCAAVTLWFVALGLYRFFDCIGRIVEAGMDLGLSVAYYFCELFGAEHSVVPTVNDYPKIPFFDGLGGAFAPETSLPETFEGFSAKWSEYWRTWATMENFQGYCAQLVRIMYFVAVGLLIAVPVVVALYVILRKLLRRENNRYAEDTKPLKAFKAIASKTYRPAKAAVSSFVGFVREHGFWWKVWAVQWLLYFNVFTILMEFIAFYLYFAVSLDMVSIYRQVYKLALDLWAPVSFIPVWAWVAIALVLIDRMRRKIGYAALRHNEMKNRGFINARPIVLMVCGTMGKKKTTAITDMALSQEVMLRDKAYEKILETDMKFPYFPWINLENTIKHGMRHHYVYNLATCRKTVRHIAVCAQTAGAIPAQRKAIRRHLKKRYGYTYGNFCFGYDAERYGEWYNDRLKMLHVWEAVETYAQLYFVYVIQSSLTISNYSIRTDSFCCSAGNFPQWDTDFFSRDTRVQDATSRHAHIIDFDALRLGKKLAENSELADSFEFGVINITEVGKERKNTLELRDRGVKATEGTNQKNDGFNDWLKMIRHSATVDNFPFVKVITDEQRPESWGADARDLCEIVHIRDSGETRLAMPLFFVEELLYSAVFGRFVRLYGEYRYRRGDNTLCMHLLKSAVSAFHHYYTRVYNTFGYCALRVQVESGTQDGELDEGRYYLASKKIYSMRFSTDCFSDFFEKKALRSAYGIDDLREYATEKATLDELKAQHSYFITDIASRE